MPTALFALVVFQIESRFFAQQAFIVNIPIYASPVAGMTGTCPVPGFLVEMGSH
jgi:hypothetical protein